MIIISKNVSIIWNSYNAFFNNILTNINNSDIIFPKKGSDNMKKHIPQILLIISMLVFGTIAVFVKNIKLSSGIDLSSQELALYRAVLASVLIALFLTITKQKFEFSKIKKEVPLLLISGIAMGINWILLFQAYKYTTVSVATLSYYFAPVIVTIACPILFKEKLTKKQIICFIFSTVGLALITGIGDLSQGKNHLIGILFGLGAACFYATVIIMNKYIKNVAGVQRTFLQFLAAIIILLPYVLLTSKINIMSLTKVSWINLLIVGLVHTGITYCLYFTALKDLPGQKAAILSYIDPLVAVLMSVFVLSEEITFVQIIGGILILGFTLYNEINLAEVVKKTPIEQ